MKKVFKRTVSMILVFMTVFSSFAILPSEFFQSAVAKAAEIFSSETGATETYTTDDFTYTLTDEYSKVQILSYIGDSTEVVIPEKIDGIKVTSIGASAFANNTSITKVTLPDTMLTIGENAFFKCSALAEVDFGNSVKTIGDRAFKMCGALTSLEFPDSLETIGNYAFTSQLNDTYGPIVESNIINISFGAGIAIIGTGAFYECNKISSVKIGDSLVSLGDLAFYDCDGIIDVSISGTNATIGSQAFSGWGTGCMGIKSVEIRGGVKSISNNAFYNCTSLESVSISEGAIGQYAFAECPMLKDVSISDSVTSIGDYAFSNCPNLSDVFIEDAKIRINSLEYNGHRYAVFNTVKTWEEAKALCESWGGHLATITDANEQNFVAEMVNKSGASCWLGASDAETEGVWKWVTGEEFSYTNWNTNQPDNTYYDDYENYLHMYTYETNNKWNDLTNVGSRGSCGFICEWDSLDDIDGVKHIIMTSDSSYVNLEGITSTNVLTIGNYAFYNCTGLKSFTIPDRVTSMGNNSLDGCTSLKELHIGTEVTSIPSNVLGNTISLEKITVSSDNSLYSSKDGVLFNKDQTSLLAYPKDKKGAYTVPGTVKTIADSAFYNCDGLTELVVGNSVTTIEKYAFGECSNLKKVTLGDGLQTIGDNTFNGCTSLTDIDFGNSVKTIGNRAFKLCRALTKLDFPDSLEAIGDFAFTPYSTDTLNPTYYTNNIKEISFGSGIKTIGVGAFYNSDNFTSIELGKSLNTIGDYAFYECDAIKNISISGTNATIGKYAFAGGENGIEALETVEIKNGVSSISDYAFYNAFVLKSVNIPDSVTSIGNYAFSNCAKLTDITIEDKTAIKALEYNGHIYAVFDIAKTWEETEALCESWGGHLVTITNADEQAFVSEITNKLGKHCLLGGTDVERESEWKWITGEPFSYSKWSSGEPNNVGDEDYLLIYYNQGNTWNDVPNTGSSSAYGFVCEWEQIDDIDSVNHRIMNKNDSCVNSIDDIKSTNPLTIGNYAFYNCTGLESFTIPGRVVSMGNNSLDECKSLKELHIGSGLTSIPSNAFGNTISLENINVSPSNTVYSSKDGVLFNKDQTSLLVYPKAKKGAYTIPETVKTIADSAFYNCDGLTELVVGDSVETIDTYAFGDCSNLTKVTLGDGLQTIGTSAFYNCEALVDVDFGNSVKTIGVTAFKMCKSIKTLNFPDSLETIRDYAFTPYLNNYDGTYYGSSITDIHFGSGIKTICYSAFYNCDNITAVEIGESLSIIGRYAFYDCDGIKSVSISGNNATIGDFAFDDCSLETLVLGKGITSIGDYVFEDHSKLTVYCYEGTYGHTYAKTNLPNATIKFIGQEYFVTDLTVTQLSSKSATFTWKKPSGYENIDHYIIYKDGVKYDETVNTSYSDSNLSSGKQYCYAVAAVDTNGTISELTSLYITPACSIAKSIAMPDSNNHFGGLAPIKLTGIMNDSFSKSGATGKFLYSSDGETWLEACNANVQSDGVSYVGYWDLTNVISGDYKLRFIFTDKDGGESFTDLDINVDRIHPAKIDQLNIIPKETSIELSWQISKEYDTKIYRIYRKADNEEEYELISEIRDRDTLTYSDINVEKGVIYSYYIVGTDKFGQQSLAYDVVSAGLIDDIKEPTFTKMTPASGSYIYGNYKFTVLAIDNVGVTKTELYYTYKENATDDDWELLYTYNGSSFSTYVDTTVMNSGVVYIKAVIYDAVGNYTVTGAYKYMCDNQGPEKVIDLTCVSTGGTIATLSWSDVTDDDIQYYIVEQKLADGSYKEVVRSNSYLGANLTKLTPDTEYTYRVVGYDKRGNRGIPSDDLTVKTTVDTIAPAVTTFSPAPGYYSKNIPLRLIATDDHQVKSIELEASYNKKVWSSVAVIEADTLSPTYAFSYNLDISTYNEGSVYIRAKVTDSYGNTTSDENATCHEYIVDRTAPAIPTGLTASSDENYVALNWNTVADDESFAYYRVYRSTKEDGDYTIIKNNLNTVNTYDTSVDYSATYYYKIKAVDKAGNESLFSTVISCKVKDDEEAPVIYDIYPSNGSVISAKNSQITVSAADNAKLSNLKLEYRTNSLFSTYTTLKEVTGNTRSNCTVSGYLPIAELGNGTEVIVRATAMDASGNIADEKTATYTIDTEAPNLKSLSVSESEDTENKFTLSWSVDECSDLVCFYVYRQASGNSSYVLYDTVLAERGKTSYTYIDDEFEASCSSVKYKIEAYDVVANTSSLETETMNVSGNVEPMAMINCPSSVVKDSEYLFDATDSYDDVLITNYCFDFGDGSEPVNNTDGKVIYSYSKEGTYTFKLSVTDNDGNIVSKEKKITVTSRELIGTVTVNVVDDNNNKLPNTPVYVNLGEDSEQYAITDSNGNVTFDLSVGTHTIASYKTDYLPVKQQVAVTGGELYVRLTLVNEPIVTGEFEIHRMTFDEIVAAGIDINAAENRNVVRINVTLMYEKQPIKQSYYWNGSSICNPEPIYINTSSGSRKLTPHVIGGGNYTSSPSTGGGGGVATPALENPTVVFIDVPVDMSFLKDFFSVSLHIVNHASSDFSLLDNSITLNVPDGLTVMKTDVSAPNANVYIEEIQGQTQETIKWILRGDKPGEYEISADYLGRLSYFNEPVTAKFIADDTIEVLNSSTLKVDIETSDTTFGGRVFYNIVVENTGKYEYNDFRWESPIETYYDEYIDANGNSSEMKEQRNVLAPGEKFVYHVFTQLKGGYNYLDSIIKDYGNSGAQIGVTLHKPDYFLDLFYEIFPEESGAFVYRVHDTEGNSLNNAKIELNPETILSIDSEREYVIVEDRNVECNSIKVTCDGYYDYIDNDYNGPKWGKGETIVLHKEGVFAVDYVKLNNVNVLESNASFDIQQKNSDGTSKQIKFTSKIYGDVLSVDLVQNGKIITPVNRASTPETFMYTNTYAVDKFEEGEQIYLSVTLDKTKHSEDPKPILLKIGVDNFQIPEMKLPQITDMKVVIPHYIDFIGGYEISFDDFFISGITAAYNTVKREVTYGINIDLENLDNRDFKKLFGDIGDELLAYTEMDVEDFKKPQDADIGIGMELGGTITFCIGDDNKIHFKGSEIKLSVSGEISKNFQFFAGPVPLTLEVSFGAGASFSIAIGYEYETKDWDIKLERSLLTLSLGIAFGLGCPVASVGIYGQGEAGLSVQIADEFQCLSLALEAEFGLYVKLFMFKKNYELLKYEDNIVFAGEDEDGNTGIINNLIKSMYSADGYEMNDDLLSYNSIWNSPVSGTLGTQTLLRNSYAGAKPQIVTCGNDIVLVYLGVDTSSDVANAVSMYYSVFNKETGKWGVPAKFDDNNLTDSSYSLCVSDGKIHAVYAQSCNEFSEESTIEDVAQSMELYTTTFDSNTKKFVAPVKLTENNTLDTAPVLKSVNGVPTAVWINNASNNVFLNDNANSIYMSQFVNGEWTAPKQLQSNLNSIHYIDVAQLSKNSCVVYSTDTDNDLSTTNDKKIWLYDCGTSTVSELATETESAVVTAEIYDNPVALWYNDGKLMQYDIEGAQLTEVCEVSSGLANGFELVSDSDGNYAIVYTENSKNICAMYLDTMTSKWSAPIVLVSGDENIENLEAEYINGKLTLMYDKTSVDFSDDLMELSSEFVTTVIDSYAKPEIVSTFVDYDAITPSEEATLSVEVMNNGSTPTGDLEFNVYNYDGTLLGKYTTSNISLSSTESKTFEVPFTAPSDIINKDIRLTVNDATKQHLSSKNISLAVCDMYVDSYQVTKGDKKYIKSVIKNYSHYSSPVTFEVFNRLTDEVYYSTNLSSVYKGSPRTVEIELDESYIDENKFISTRVISKAGDYYSGNDISMFEYLEYIPETTISTEPEETTVSVPSTTVPVTTTPLTTVPVTTVPESSIETEPEETTLPITTVPVTTVPVSTVPVTTVTVPSTVPTTTVVTEPTETVPVSIPREKVLIGDVDLDGRVSIKDSTLLQKYIVEYVGFNASQKLAADCDFDGKISVRDATLIQKYIVDFPNCGYVGQYLVDVENATTLPVTTTQPITTIPVTTKPVTTAPITTVPATTVPVTTVPVTTAPNTTQPITVPESKYTVIFTNAQNWSGTIYCYYWESGNSGPVVWPGTAMNYVSGSTYTVSVPKSADYVIFTNGGEQTVDIPFNGSQLSFYAKAEKDNSGHNYYATGTPVSTKTVTFTNSLKWGGTIYCYYWRSGNSGPIAWPGKAMNYKETNGYGEAVYTAEIPNDADCVIFTNGSSQTVDIYINNSSMKFYAKPEVDSSNHHYYGTW